MGDSNCIPSRAGMPCNTRGYGIYLFVIGDWSSCAHYVLETTFIIYKVERKHEGVKGCCFVGVCIL